MLRPIAVGPVKTISPIPRQKEEIAALTTPSKSVCVTILPHKPVTNPMTFLIVCFRFYHTELRGGRCHSEKFTALIGSLIRIQNDIPFLLKTPGEEGIIGNRCTIIYPIGADAPQGECGAIGFIPVRPSAIEGIPGNSAEAVLEE